MNLMIVVFPVPGPPVIMHTLLVFTSFTAYFCLLDKIILVDFYIFLNFESKFLMFLILFAFSNATIFSAMFFSQV